MNGETQWVESQTYGNNAPLFRKSPKWEKKEDSNNSSVIAPPVIRLQRILEKAGIDKKDPIGLSSHFSAWIETAKSGTLLFPVLFLNMNQMSGRNNSGVVALKKFINITNLNEDDFSYEPNRRKAGDIMIVRFTLIKFIINCI